MKIDLSRPRDLGAVLSDSLRLYFRNFGTFVLISAAIVVPAELVVSGIGLEQISADYDGEPSAAEVALPVAVGLLVITPLVAAMTIHALLEAAEGRRPAARRSIMAGLDAFTPVFLVILLAACATLAACLPGVLLAPASIGFGTGVALAGAVYVGVRLYFVVQAAVIERLRGMTALRRSWALAEGSWWRIFGIAAVVALVALVPAQLLAAPLEAAAIAADRAAFSLLGSMIAQVLSAPLLVIGGTLLYFDLSARSAGYTPPPVAPPGPADPEAGGPPDPPGLPRRD